MRRRLPVLLLVNLALGCEFSSEPPVETLQEPIAGGEVDVVHRSVFATTSHHDGYASFCTATLIAPNLLLTARHCVSEGGADQVICGETEFTTTIPADTIFATNDTIPAEDSLWFRGLEVRVPAEGNDTCGFDVALIVLGSVVPASVATPAIPRIDEPVAAGESYLAVGYGNTSDTEDTGGTRMVRGELEVQCAPSECPASVIESTEFLGETGICSGDSGGPAIDMEGKVVGVVSRGSDNCQTPIYGTVTAWRDWLMTNALEAATLGGYPAPTWATTGSSEPPVTPSPDPDPAPTPAPGGDGQACSQPADCLSGFSCYFDSDPADAVCRASCSLDADCSGGLSCAELGNGAGVCLSSSGDAGESGGCTLSRSGQGSNAALLALAIAALLPLRRRATRKPH